VVGHACLSSFCCASAAKAELHMQANNTGLGMWRVCALFGLAPASRKQKIHLLWLAAVVCVTHATFDLTAAAVCCWCVAAVAATPVSCDLDCLCRLSLRILLFLHLAVALEKVVAEFNTALACWLCCGCWALLQVGHSLTHHTTPLVGHLGCIVTCGLLTYDQACVPHCYVCSGAACCRA
jgi:hypothetical protein